MTVECLFSKYLETQALINSSYNTIQQPSSIVLRLTCEQIRTSGNAILAWLHDKRVMLAAYEDSHMRYVLKVALTEKMPDDLDPEKTYTLHCMPDFTDDVWLHTSTKAVIGEWTHESN